MKLLPVLLTLSLLLVTPAQGGSCEDLHLREVRQMLLLQRYFDLPKALPQLMETERVSSLKSREDLMAGLDLAGQKELMVTLVLAEFLLQREFNHQELLGFKKWHELGEAPFDRAEILAKYLGLRQDFDVFEAKFFMRTGLTGRGGYQNRYEVSEPPEVAQQIVDNMRGVDALTVGVTPPGVRIIELGGGRFRAEAPFGGGESHHTVVSNGRGGSYVTEHFVSDSFLPGVHLGINLAHGIFTNSRKAYGMSQQRMSGGR